MTAPFLGLVWDSFQVPIGLAGQVMPLQSYPVVPGHRISLNCLYHLVYIDSRGSVRWSFAQNYIGGGKVATRPVLESSISAY